MAVAAPNELKRVRLRMVCESCGKDNQGTFIGEFAIHFLGLANADTPPVHVFPVFNVCLDCGASKFTVPETELEQLRNHRPQDFKRT